MPKVNNKYSTQIGEDTPGQRTTIIDPVPDKFLTPGTNRTPELFRALTRVVPNKYIVVKDTLLRSKRIVVKQVLREPVPGLTIANPHAHHLLDLYCEKFHFELKDRILDRDWESKVDLERYASAFPANLRNAEYLNKHLHALYVTGLIDNLGPNTTLAPIAYLESHIIGRIFLANLLLDRQLINQIVGPEEDWEPDPNPSHSSFILRLVESQIWRVREGLANYRGAPYHPWTSYCWQCWALLPRTLAPGPFYCINPNGTCRSRQELLSAYHNAYCLDIEPQLGVYPVPPNLSLYPFEPEQYIVPDLESIAEPEHISSNHNQHE